MQDKYKKGDLFIAYEYDSEAHESYTHVVKAIKYIPERQLLECKVQYFNGEEYEDRYTDTFYSDYPMLDYIEKLKDDIEQQKRELDRMEKELKYLEENMEEQI